MGLRAVALNLRCHGTKVPVAKKFIGHDHMILRYIIVEGCFSLIETSFGPLQISRDMKNGKTLLHVLSLM